MTSKIQTTVDFDRFIYYVEGITVHQWDQLRGLIPEISSAQAVMARTLNLENSARWASLDVLPTTPTTVAIELQNSPVEPSYCWTRDVIPATVVDDVLTSLSLVNCVIVGASKIIFQLGTSNRVTHSVGNNEAPILGGLTLSGTQSQEILTESIFRAIRVAGPKPFAALGLGTSVDWYRQAQIARITSLTITEIALYWTTLEVFGTLGLTVAQSRSTSKRKIVERGLKSVGITNSQIQQLDTLLKEAYEVRNSAFHSGITASVTNLADLRDKTAVLVSLILLLKIGVSPDIAGTIAKVKI